ncbi:FtsB family cell division protein [Pseudarthrobacter sp. P1]|uniref:FtsB family cell division protein n=1 Tax=Pseudarthrobacter sp. P1 TaxID=3418418 RepID=UPI003CF17DF3
MATRRPRMPRAQQAAGTEEGHAGTAPAQPDASIAAPGARGRTPKPDAGNPPAGNPPAGNPDAAAARRAAARTAGATGTRTSPGTTARTRFGWARNAAKGAGGHGSVESGPVPVPARAFSGRLLALAVVLVTITVLLAPAVHTFLQQRAEISALKADIAAREKVQSDLTTQLGRWDDPAYVKQQARERVNMMMPGETGYWVYDGSGGSATPENSEPTDGAAGTGAGQSPGGTSLPWVDGLWESIKRSAAP